MKTYLQMDGDRLVEYVEKREYDLLAQDRADFGALVDKQERELGDLISLLASEKSTRNHMIKRGAELERELDDLKSQRADFGALVDKLECELNALKLLLNEVYASFADEPQSDSSWLLDDRQLTALSKIKPFLKP